MLNSRTKPNSEIVITQPYKEPDNRRQQSVKTIKLTSVQYVVEDLKRWLSDSYEHLRSVASEILVFMLTDLDRIYDMESVNAHIVAYALKGPSMKNEVLRNMTKDVIATCENRGLNVSVTSSDGQWHQYGVLDDNKRPLTVHQLHRQVWNKLRSLPKPKLQTMLRRHCLVQSVDDIQYQKIHGQLSLLGHKHDRMINISASEPEQLMSCLTDETDSTDDVDDTVVNENEIKYYGCLAGDPEQMIGPETIDTIDRAVDAEQILDNRDDYAISYDILDEEVDTVLLDLDEQSYDDLPAQIPSYEHDMNCLQQDKHIESYPYMNISTTVDCGETSYLFGEASRVLNPYYTCGIDSTTDMNSYQTNSLGFEASRILNPDDIREFGSTEVMHIYHTESYEYEDMSTHANSSANVPMYVATVQSSDTSSDIHEPLYTTTNTNTQMKRSYMDVSERQVQCTGKSIIQSLNMDDFTMMLHDLQHNDKCMKTHNWLDIDINTFIQRCSNKVEMNKHFQKLEVYICAKSIENNSKNVQLKVMSSWPKYKLLESMFDVKNEDVREINPTKRRRVAVSSLQDLCWKQFKDFSKNQLLVVLAENEWNNEFSSWKNNSPVPYGVSIVNVANDMQWFTQPCIDDDGNIRFHFTDACHLLTCLRTKLCTTGIQGLERKAWEIAALSKETKLNITVVVDCVDKQDVALARRVFAEDVEKVIESNVFVEEAKFCRLIRLWYDAEDEPAISAIERCKRRMNLLSWLLEGYTVGKFPPATRYIKGIPIVTYEALVCHLERKLQLHAFVPGSKFNVRATGTQEVEQLFSSFRDMDPSGSGTVKPDLIPDMLASAVEIDSIRLNPDKPFYVRTSNANVYPSHTSESPEETPEFIGTYKRTQEEAKAIQTIYPRDHAFDSENRGRRTHSRPSGLISEPSVPAHGERGVRQFHRRDDSKILAHRRLGFMDLPDL